jgi:hypothetical protein
VRLQDRPGREIGLIRLEGELRGGLAELFSFHRGVVSGLPLAGLLLGLGLRAAVVLALPLLGLGGLRLAVLARGCEERNAHGKGGKTLQPGKHDYTFSIDESVPDTNRFLERGADGAGEFRAPAVSREVEVIA